MVEAIENQKITPSPINGQVLPRTRGGKRPGSGRKPHPKDPTLLARAYALLDEATLPAVQCLVTLMTSENETIRLKAALGVLAKRIADMQHFTGAPTGTTVNVYYGHQGQTQGVEQRIVVAQPLAGNGTSH